MLACVFYLLQQGRETGLRCGDRGIMRRTIHADERNPVVANQQIGPDQFSGFTVEIIIAGEGKGRVIVGEIHSPFRPSAGQRDQQLS